MNDEHENNWSAVADEPATADQRRTLYRLGLTRSVVAKLSRTDASKAIQQMLVVRQQLGGHGLVTSKEHDD